MSVGEALSDLLGKAMILSTELQDGCHKGLPEVDEFQAKVWILSERLDDWRVVLSRNGGSNHLLRNLCVAQDILTSIRKNLRSWFERWKRNAIPILMQGLFVLNNILETGDATSTQLPAGLAAARRIPALSHGRDRIDLPVAGSSLDTQEGPDDGEGPSAVSIHRDLGMEACTVMEKAMLFTTQLQNRCYKHPAELAEFKKKLWLLSAGLSENEMQCSVRLGERPNSKHGHFLRALKVFETILDKELRYIRNPSFRLKRKALPRQLLYVLNEILTIVGVVANCKHKPLPLGLFRRYVPISSVQEVREILQDETAPNVVTVYGGPGLGKSMLVRYLAYSYQEETRRLEAIWSPAISSPPTVYFSDGVYFFVCGHRASRRMRQLQLEILNCLGSAAQLDDLTDAGKQEGGYVALLSYERRMRSLLAQRNALIIFDDVWEPEVVEKLVVPSTRVKYLITSQINDICRLIRVPRAAIEIQRPTLTQARQILANYTDGLPREGELPDSLENEADAVIGALESHPLYLSTFALGIEISQATVASYWEAQRSRISDHEDFFQYYRYGASTSGREHQHLIVDDREGDTSPDHRQGTSLVMSNWEAGRDLDSASSLRDHTDGIGSPAHSEGSCSPDCGGWRPIRLYGP